MAATVDKEDQGSFIPATQRPDGTWRKPRRIKEGYVPQEEVPLYESKGKQWASRQANYIPGLDPALIKAKQQAAEKLKNTIPGLVQSNQVEGKKKKKKKKKNSEANCVDESSPLDDTKPEPVKNEEVKNKLVKNEPEINASVNTDPTKRLRNLKKKLREIETIEANLSSKKPDKDQLEKIARKSEVLSEILALELSLQN